MAIVPASSHGTDLSTANTWTANQTAPAWVASGLTGATAASRYVGATASGAPGSGTFAIGDFVMDQTGKVYICTVAGTPGTWVSAAGTPATAVAFSSTLGVDTASIDTGANGIAGGYSIMEAWLIARTDDAGATATMTITLNNDGGSKYDRQSNAAVNTTAFLDNALAATQWTYTVHGSGGTANYFTAARLSIPFYTGAAAYKAGEMSWTLLDGTAASCRVQSEAIGFRDTTAISRMKIAASGAAKLKAGSGLYIVLS